MPATRLYVRLPNVEEIQYLDVQTGELVYDGRDFQDPSKTQFVSLHEAYSEGDTIPFPESVHCIVTSYLRLNVIDRVAVANSSSDPRLILAEDPTNGECICGITCDGIRLAYVEIRPAP